MLKPSLKVFSSCLLSLLISSQSMGEIQKNKSRDIDLAHFKLSTLQISEKEFSEEAIKEWYFNMKSLNKYVYQKLSDSHNYNESKLRRLTHLVVNNAVSAWLTRASYITLHEAAHARAIVDAGGEREDITFYIGDERTDSVGEFYLKFVTNFARGGISYYVPDKSFEDQAIISAAGINAQAEFARELALDSISEGFFHHTDTSHYLMNKIVGAVYYYYDPDSSSSDIDHYVTALQEQNYINKDEIDKTKKFIAYSSILTTLLSGRTWESFNALYNEFDQNISYSDTFSLNTAIGKVTWPEFNLFLNRENISVKADSLLINDDFRFGLSYETSILGYRENEYSASFEYDFDNWQMRIEGIYNDQGYGGLNAGAKYHYSERVSFFLKGSIDNGTLDGRRDFYLLNNSEYDFESRIAFGVEVRLD